MMIASDEFSFINWLRQQPLADSRVILGPGDDTAILRNPKRDLLLTTDLLMDGVDFHLHQADPQAIGHKAMAANLSDIAAMAGEPLAALVALALPTSAATSARIIAEKLMLGIRELADSFAVSIVGGDTNSWNQGLAICITILGQVGPRGAVRRSGACPGNWIFVTGPVGGSIRGRHLKPTPRIREALRLQELGPLTAMIDISDGLAADLAHILEESRCGAVLHADQIPIHPDAYALATETGKTPLYHALNDGEDFELIFTTTPEVGKRFCEMEISPGLSLYKIGECVASGYWLEHPTGRTPIIPQGWVHPLNKPSDSESTVA
jgi:thiamine-monophosphate kinase